MSEIKEQAAERKGYVIVTDYIPADESADAADAIQAVIEANPNRTIYFPDRVYRLSKPICTPADPKKSVDLQLSTYAVICPAENWDSEEAMIRLGGICPFNSIYINGSNYSLSGGILDGLNFATGVSIDSGRETAIRNVSIKHTKIGIHIKHGANSGSSDADIMNVNITGTGKTDSIGVLVYGYDNSFTNMRIANVFRGFEIHSGGNVLKNIHPLYTCDYTDYQEGAAFFDAGNDNWYNFCYSDQFAVGFRTAGRGRITLESCFCYWYSSRGEKCTAFRADGTYNAVAAHCKAGFRQDTENHLLVVGEPGGCGVVANPIFDPARMNDDTFKDYLQGKVCW